LDGGSIPPISTICNIPCEKQPASNGGLFQLPPA
jgi:hypothetical protein